MGEYDIKQQQFVVLNEIVRNGPLNQKQLTGELLFEKSNVSKRVKVMIKKGLIHAKFSKTDGRVTVLTHTSDGFDVWQKCMDRLNDWDFLFTSSLTEKEIDQFTRLLEKLLITERN